MSDAVNAESRQAVPTSGDGLWAKAFSGAMLLVTALGVLVLGVIAVVALRDNGGGTASAAGSATQVDVRLSEFKIELSPAVVPPGDVTFMVHNVGTVEHNFVVPTLGVRTNNLKPGEMATLAVTNVGGGSYDYLCDIAGHEAAGMKGTLAVEAGASVATAAAAPATGGMSWQQMDAMMEAVAKRFPEKTEGAGNGELGFRIDAEGFKVFDLTASVIPWEVEKGKFVDGWAYNGQIPGPIIRINVGDKVRVNLKNELPESTSLHLHGIRVPNGADGVDPYTQPAIKPGESFTYEFVALEPAVGMYHSHHNAQVQVPNGLAGAMLIGDWKEAAMGVARSRVQDTDGDAESEIVMVLNDSGTIGLSLNGKSFPATEPYALKVGESAVVHYYNEGNMTHPMHLHQPAGLVVAHDGKLLEAPFWADTLNVAPGERWTVVYTALDPGVWAWHCHILTHAETPEGMRYMVTALIVE